MKWKSQTLEADRDERSSLKTINMLSLLVYVSGSHRCKCLQGKFFCWVWSACIDPQYYLSTGILTLYCIVYDT